MPAQMDPNDEKQYWSRHYSDAIAAAGGLSITIPLLEESDRVRRVGSIDNQRIGISDLIDAMG